MTGGAFEKYEPQNFEEAKEALRLCRLRLLGVMLTNEIMQLFDAIDTEGIDRSLITEFSERLVPGRSGGLTKDEQRTLLRVVIAAYSARYHHPSLAEASARAETTQKEPV